MNTPAPPPAAVIIRLAREAAGIRVADAAAQAGISVARWSQIENGHETRQGEIRPARAKSATLARMAAAVGVPSERMEAEGRDPEAAAIMREIERQAPAVPPVPLTVAADLAGDSTNDSPPSPSAAAFAHAFGVTDNPSDPFVQSVRRDIADAIMTYGAGAGGPQIFHGRPWSADEARLWDSPRIPRADKEMFIAGMRAERARNESGQGSGASRIGLVPAAASRMTLTRR